MDLFSIFLVALSLILVVVAAAKLYKSRVPQRSHDKVQGILKMSDVPMNFDRSATQCSSPDCYHCTNNLETLQTALTKLSYRAHDNDSGSLDIQNISADVKKSIDRIKHPDKSISDLLCSEVKSSSPVVFKMSGLREEELWSLSDFPALQLLQTHFRHIQLEFFNLYKSPLPETKCLWKLNSTDSGKWEIAQLIDQGRKTRAAELCPLTMEVLKKIPYFISGNVFGDASFSVVHSDTYIATHCGTTNCRIRCHLGLKVPGDNCILKVGGQTCCWREGEVMCFNDAFPHSVHHRGKEESGLRAVFILDLWHPDITESQKGVLNYAFSS